MSQFERPKKRSWSKGKMKWQTFSVPDVLKEAVHVYVFVNDNRTVSSAHSVTNPLLSPWNTIRRHFWSCTGKLFIFCNEEVCRAPNISRKIGLPALPWTKVVVWGTGRSSMKQKLRTHWHSHSSEHSQHFFLIFNFYLIFFINHSHIHTSVLFFCA